NRRTSREAQPKVEWLGQLLLYGSCGPSLRAGDETHPSSAAPVAVSQAQGAERGVCTLPQCLSARPTGPGPVECDAAPPAVGEGMSSCPRAGCGKPARPVR